MTRGRCSVTTGQTSSPCAFCEGSGYESVTLWTVSDLTAATHLYRAAGLRKMEEKPGRRWGADVVEERYELDLT